MGARQSGLRSWAHADLVCAQGYMTAPVALGSRVNASGFLPRRGRGRNPEEIFLAPSVAGAATSPREGDGSAMTQKRRSKPRGAGRAAAGAPAATDGCN